eukprot:6279198-Amphidinium_carterae.1
MSNGRSHFCTASLSLPQQRLTVAGESVASESCSNREACIRPVPSCTSWESLVLYAIRTYPLVTTNYNDARGLG